MQEVTRTRNDRTTLFAAALLTFTALSWSGNYVLGRAIAEEVPAGGLAVARWLLALVCMVIPAWPHLAADWPTLWRHRGIVLFLTFTGGAVFGTLHFVAMKYTSATNGALLAANSPILIATAGALLFGDTLSATRTFGLVLSLAGAVVIVARGEIGNLVAFNLNAGDPLLLLNLVIWAIYSACLRLKPRLHWLSFTFALAFVSVVANIPVALLETYHGQPMRLTATTFWSVMYAGLVSSALAFASWNRGVELIGSQRAGAYLNLIPLFSVLLAWLLLGERLQPFHMVGCGLIVSGIVVSTRTTQARS